MTTLQNGDRKISVRLGTTTSETKTITTKEKQQSFVFMTAWKMK